MKLKIIGKSINQNDKKGNEMKIKKIPKNDKNQKKKDKHNNKDKEKHDSGEKSTEH